MLCLCLAVLILGKLSQVSPVISCHLPIKDLSLGGLVKREKVLLQDNEELVTDALQLLLYFHAVSGYLVYLALLALVFLLNLN